MLLHDVIMASYWRHSVFTCLHCPLPITKAHRARATVELLRALRTPEFIASNPWPPNSPDLNPVNYDIWAVMQHRIYGLPETNPYCSLIETAAHRCLMWSWTVDVWWGYCPVARKTSNVCRCKRMTLRVQLGSWQCWFCPYLLYSVRLVWLLHF